jgi:ribosome biogenesis GTPase
VPTREERQWEHYRNNKKLRRARKQIKRNRKPKRPRQKDWIPDNLDDLDDLDALDDLWLPQRERVMPVGEQERREATLEEALAALDAEADDDVRLTAQTGGPPEQRGIVVEVSSGLCRVELGEKSLLCGLRGSLSAQDTGFTNVIAVGDRVLVSQNGSDRGVVEAVLPRRSFLARADPFHDHLRQVIVANVDGVLIVASWREPHLWFELVDRYLVAARRNGLTPVICVNKIDLAKDPTTCRAALEPYQALGYRVLFTSALTGQGVDALRHLLRGQTTVLAGMSGVGKSSLLNAAQPNLDLRTRQVSQASREGQHTTTQVTLLKLEEGSFVVDTPGIREFGLSGLRRAELAQFYPEIEAAAAGCRFADCSHTHEPGCAVKAAARGGHVSETRYHSYTKILASLPD